jgi:hypothetical protein
MYWEAEVAKLNKLYEEYLENLKKERHRARYSNESNNYSTNRSQYWDNLHKAAQGSKAEYTRTQSTTSEVPITDLKSFPNHYDLRKPHSNTSNASFETRVLFELVKRDGKVFATISKHKDLGEELRLSDGTLLARAVRNQDNTSEVISIQDAKGNHLGSISTKVIPY